MGDCMDGVCGKCRAAKAIVLGVVLFIATWWAQSKGNIWLIWYTIAVVLVLKGLAKLAMPSCGHCSADMPMKRKK